MTKFLRGLYPDPKTARQTRNMLKFAAIIGATILPLVAMAPAANAAGAKWQMVVFSGVLHAYTDQGLDVPGVAAWDEPATRQTYAMTHRFIEDAFAGQL